ncbi:S-adenosyl-L-methionine-dependent methyltransferase [Endogone sp. FLAS-F59071]|nr:S-adenosyl-L-methionine-dependent methyltransferase [Endogone sp. FLAS-F59071]|eukprot:RUS17716.1 S-adenosyl-L-methionine-dependent methyltransferase [Endogone sp. FLAS-F59071]
MGQRRGLKPSSMGAIVSTSNVEAIESWAGSDESTPRDSTDQPPEEPPGFKWVAGRRSTLGEGANSNLVLPADDELTDSRQILHYCLSCGVGQWSLEMATEFPNSSFVGTDIDASALPKPRNSAMLPPNVTFQVANTCGKLPFPNNSFDYVFQRYMTLELTTKQWQKAIKELVRVTKPGGWIELVEPDLLYWDRGPTFANWNDKFLQLLISRNINPRLSPQLEQTLAHAGLEQTYSDFHSWPQFAGRRFRELTLRSAELDIEALRPEMARALKNFSPQEYDHMAKKALKELVENKTWLNVYWTVGRKPVGGIVTKRKSWLR